MPNTDPNENLSRIVALTLNQSINPQTAPWSCVDGINILTRTVSNKNLSM